VLFHCRILRLRSASCEQDKHDGGEQGRFGGVSEDHLERTITIMRMKPGITRTGSRRLAASKI